MTQFKLQKPDWHERLQGKKAVVGLDGFIDTLTRPIRAGASGSRPEYFATLNEFGHYIAQRSGRSASVELDPFDERIGGNAPNMASGLLALNVNTRLAGTLGVPALHPLFQTAFEASCVLSLANPGQSISYEFSDGKLMCAINRDVNALDWASLINRIGLAALEAFYQDSTLAAFVNWSEMQHAGELWEGVIEHIFDTTGYPEWMFFDLSDCSRKSADELRLVTQLMRRCASRSKTVLSLNENEKNAICAALTISGNATGQDLLSALDGYAVVYHYLSQTHAFDKNSSYTFQNHVVQKPRISTGGGDNFNAGLCAALLAGYPLSQAAMVGSFCGSYYVEFGRSASFEALERGIRDLI